VSSRVHFSPSRPPAVRIPTPRGPFAFGLTLLIAVLLLAFTSTGGGSTALSSPSSAYTDYSTPTPSPSAANQYVSSSYAHVWTFSESGVGGYTATGTLRIGDPQHFTAGLTNGTTTVGVACQVDETTDAVVPAQLMLMNTTTSFPMSVGVSIGGLGPFGNGESLEWEGHYTSGNDCSSSASFGLSSNDPLQPQHSISVNGFFVLHNYYTPDHPGGDEVAWAAAQLTVSKQQVAHDDKLTLVGFAGPGSTDGGYGWSFSPTGVG